MTETRVIVACAERKVHWYLGAAYQAAGKPDLAKQEFEKEQNMKNQMSH